MVDRVITDDELELLDARPEIDLKEKDGFIEVVVNGTDGVSLLPWLIKESGELPEAFQMSMGSIVPYFVESILREADVDFSYTELDGSPWEPDREYSSAVKFYLQRKDLPSLLEMVRRTGAMDIYDIVIQLPERDIIYQHDDRLGLKGFDQDELDAIKEAWNERLDEAFED